MTCITMPAIVYDLLTHPEESPVERLYTYRHSETGEQRYAACAVAAHDDLAWMQETTCVDCLLFDGLVTQVGEAWRAGYLVGGLAP